MDVYQACPLRSLSEEFRSTVDTVNIASMKFRINWSIQQGGCRFTRGGVQCRHRSERMNSLQEGSCLAAGMIWRVAPAS